MIEYFPALPYAELSESKPSVCMVDGFSILLALDLQGQVHAFENNCPHADKPLQAGRWTAETLEILCPFHKAVFDVGNGGRVKSGPACVPIQVFATELREHGGKQVVFVGVDNSD
ncbi:MAG: hypothetical protein RJB13_2120 [Pseudomonadota bacterium]|jgi:nitrite reductase/ring-hydroxylating ferredoxin subunit